MRSPVWKKLLSVHCEYRLLQYALLLMDCHDCTFDQTQIPKERPWTENYGTSLLDFLHLLISSLLVLEPRTILQPRSKQQPAGNWQYSHIIKVRVLCPWHLVVYYHMYYLLLAWTEVWSNLFSINFCKDLKLHCKNYPNRLQVIYHIHKKRLLHDTDE